MRFALLLAVSLLAACQPAPTKPNPPPAAVITVPVATYVPIDGQLRKRCKWVKEAAPSAVFEVSNGRKRCLLQYEAQLEAIDQVQGKPVPEEDE
ncbi:TPA: hypothetical protein ACOENG_004303 [Stenotrophomonas maltophilia]|uniref:hypothetical protein n=1 Tax=Stenotrophomonas maltophilia TaxID=40324 RepID=UPI000C1626A6|nr:hypothetical protein [Stenotrophomonas maltophilia]HDS1307957.1 hypothetical protein [Stenotrophomonas maltophilia]HDS1312496.1 hypothetical protein [Stenotrophomonas maltophilia]HDS1317226.1 hypothetical protein [Stenotrophomonas maltophilia]HDS1442112.1 hypothetical protein [Stenotrophomonas maltophilia]HDS1517181.1 hypothetical protein [Stenotrophomonas maltophilia]